MFPQIFGKYVLEREIAAGGMARVFLATLRGAGGFEKRLVVKQIRPELASDQSFIGRFVAEAKTTVELSHANIVPVYELGAELGTYYIAMEFCEGVPLDQLLRQGPLTPEEGAYIGVEISRALDYAHRKAGVIHRDVTPRNVMIDPEGMVRLIDFGIASSVDPQAFVERSQGPLFGSPGHMPPEQLSRGPLTPAADVFAVATLLIETWTGRAPFRRESFEASVRALDTPPAAVGDCDARLAPLSDLIASAVAHDPRDRPGTAEEFARPLREFLRQSDLGDLARRLGRRVTEVQLMRPSQVASLSPVSAESGGGQTTGGATQTFAANDAALEWTAKIDSLPPRRRSSMPGDSARGGIPPSSNSAVFGAGHGSGSTGPLGLLALAGLTLVAALVAARWVSAGGDDLVAPPTPSAASEEQLPSRPVVAAVGATPQPSPPGKREPSVPSGAASVRSTSVAAPVRGQRALEQVPSASAVRPAPAEPVRPSQLSLTADPPARVLIDGRALGRTPLVGLKLSAGSHTVVYVNDVLGERLTTEVELSPERTRRVHADFTSATPQLHMK